MKAITRLMAAAILSFLALPAFAQKVGDGFVCVGPDGDVSVTVGRVGRLSEMTGAVQSPDPTIVHIYMESVDDFVEHAAFEAPALAGCAPDAETAFDDVAFEEALDDYLAAAKRTAPRYFTMSPGEAFGRAVEGDQG